MGETNVSLTHKDRLFKRIFMEKEALLSLYNAVNGTAYTNPDDIEVNTIEDFLYMGMKNDVSFLFTDVLNLYEQQSTVNPNMPLRGLLYMAKLYQKIFGRHVDLYSSRQVMLPTPQFIVFYNGTRDEPDRKELLLSSAFQGKARFDAALECRAVLLNINYGHNHELMEGCRQLKEYAILVKRIRDNIAAGMEKEEAVDRAVEDCIQSDVLKELLERHKGEAKDMLLSEYDEELHIENEKAISFEDGKKEGREEGIAEGKAEGKAEERAEGIRIFIEDKAEDGIPVPTIIERLLKRYGLERKEAEACIEKYLPVRTA